MSFCPNCGRQVPDGTVCNCQSIVPKQKNKFIVPVIAGVAVVAVAIGVSNVAGAGYKKPVRDLVKAINKCDTKKLLSVVIPESQLKEIKKEAKDSIIDWDALLDKMDEALEKEMKELEDDYGKNVKYSAKIVNKKKVKGDDLEDIQEEYDDTYDAEVKKAYKLKVEMSIQGKKDKDSEKISVYVVKVKGDGWKIYDFDSNAGIFDFDLDDIFDYSFF
ncbi:MAG: hypothetical protein K2H28_04795 [Ruminococcus sp.]|nr:hypothetical protein [Ruminococcus sp.]